MSVEKKHILIFVDWYYPGYKAGGPIQSCRNIVEHLKNDFRFSVVTRDTDFGEDKPYKTIKSNEWNESEDGSKVYYISSDKLTWRLIRSFVQSDIGIIYLNSFFSFYFTLLPLLFLRNKQKPVILAPRGMLGIGALEIKSFKKRFFLFISTLFGLYKNVSWHASTYLEAEEIKRVFPNASINVAPNLPSKRELKYFSRVKGKNTINLFFLSRISTKKNLLAVFDYLEKIKDKYQVLLDVIGPSEDQVYWKQCEQRIALLQKKKNIVIRYVGSVPHSELTERLKEYHFLILPTLNENFGHVIIDAFAAGCPVIISDQTPWRNLTNKGVGWDIPLNSPDLFVTAIEEAASMTQESYYAMSEKAFQLAVNYFQNKDIIEQNRKLFQK